MKILVFGNPLLENDSLPQKLLPRLKDNFPEIEFRKIDPTEDLKEQEQHLIILDSVGGIDKVIIQTFI